MKVEVDGDLLRQALEHGFSRTADAAGRFPQISGMAIEADLGAPVGSRLKSVTVAGAPLDPGKTYRLATLDFIVRGGDGYAMFADAPRASTSATAPCSPPSSWRRSASVARSTRRSRTQFEHRRLNERPRHASCSGTNRWRPAARSAV